VLARIVSETWTNEGEDRAFVKSPARSRRSAILDKLQLILRNFERLRGWRLIHDEGVSAPYDARPPEWREIREQAHLMLDDMMNYAEHIRERPVWRPIPDEVRATFRSSSPSTKRSRSHREFTERILPYTTGNVHPAFMGWVHGGGSVVMLAEIAAGLNANLGGRDHAPTDRAPGREWVRQMFDFPPGATGLFVTGTSIANFLSITVARTAALGTGVRRAGIAASGIRLTGYASEAAHGCVRQAFELSGLGGDSLRAIPSDGLGRIEQPI
jgi:hypothetical protein